MQWICSSKSNQMKSNEEYLNILLSFLGEILEDEKNNWFHDELAILFSKKFKSERDSDIKLAAITVKELGSIDKYLDEGIVPIIDYGGIKEEKSRFQLERDAIEMGKARLSNYSQQISFEKFCKYAHYQSEELVNYYYRMKSGNNIDEVKKLIREFNPKFVEWDKKRYRTISSISHGIKLYAIWKNLRYESDCYFTINNVARVRNLEVHRDSLHEIDQNLQSFIRCENYNEIYEALTIMRDKIISEIDT